MSTSTMWGFLAHGIGCIVLLKLIVGVVQWIYSCFIRQGKKLTDYGEWAIVTGATDGIGKAVALEFASKGLKVLLISRTPERLAETKKEVLETKGAVDCEVLALDCGLLGTGDEKARTLVENAVKGKNIAVLYNNVGVSYDFANYFDEISDDRVGQLINLNVGATTWMTRIVVKEMLKKDLKTTKSKAGNSDNTKGMIVSVASSSATASCPLLSQYSAAKEYVIRFMQSLGAELEGKGIHCQVQPAHFVTSKLSKIRNPSLFTATPKSFAMASVKAIGYEREISPFWSHYVFVSLMKNLPTELVEWASMKLHLDIRKRAMKKLTETAKKE